MSTPLSKEIIELKLTLTFARKRGIMWYSPPQFSFNAYNKEVIDFGLALLLGRIHFANSNYETVPCF